MLSNRKADTPQQYRRVNRRYPYKFGGPVGLCLNCHNKLTLCGVPFTLEIMCCKCKKINVYEDSQQPVRIIE